MYYVLVNSITLATRIKNHFRFSGKRVSIMHTPAEISKGGCSYSVVIEPSMLDDVLSVAKDYGISIKGVYEQTGTGFSEVKPL